MQASNVHGDQINSPTSR